MSDNSILLPPAVETPIEMESTTSEMEVDREVDMPPTALPPPAMPPPTPTVVEASPNSSEREEITNWMQKIHRQIGHRDNHTLVRLLKNEGHIHGF